MDNQYDDTIVISLGGSLIVPDQIDTAFLTKFRELVESFVEDGKRFFIITGGGKVCRRYQGALQEIRDVVNDELDWLGIHVTRLNAQLVRHIFGDLAYDHIVLDPADGAHSDKPVTIGAGWKPGCSTDYDAVAVAREVGAGKVINLSNIDYVYTKDPKKYADAEKIVETTWPAFRDLLPDEWDPGLNTPFDPLAAAEAEKYDIEVALLNGEDPDNIRKYINREDYIGTVIAPVEA